MTASVHQPHFLPWMGYLNKVLHSDVFIWLHTVQYRKNYFQNRTLIKNVNEQPLWLTLPVHAYLGMTIDAVQIADPHWRRRVTRTLEQCYRKASFFEVCWPPLLAAFEAPGDDLEGVNYRTFEAILDLLDADEVRLVRAGTIAVGTDDPSGRLVELCRAVGATRYIAGRGGHNYVNAKLFAESGIELVWQEFDPARVVYPQLGRSFLPGLSIVDCLFNVGPAKTRELALAAWTP